MLWKFDAVSTSEQRNFSNEDSRFWIGIFDGLVSNRRKIKHEYILRHYLTVI